jgi:hypothetical protein
MAKLVVMYKTPQDAAASPHDSLNLANAPSLAPAPAGNRQSKK